MHLCGERHRRYRAWDQGSAVLLVVREGAYVGNGRVNFLFRTRSKNAQSGELGLLGQRAWGGGGACGESKEEKILHTLK